MLRRSVAPVPARSRARFRVVTVSKRRQRIHTSIRTLRTMCFPMARTLSTISIELVAVGLIAASALSFGITSAGMASGYVDPLLHAGAQDEAVYGHAAARMVRTGHWMTPVFLDRFMLNKPPLLMWLGAASMRVAGMNRLALRLPGLAAGGLCGPLIYW